jgi:hypothetical protein
MSESNETRQDKEASTHDCRATGLRCEFIRASAKEVLANPNCKISSITVIQKEGRRVQDCYKQCEYIDVNNLVD